MNKKFKKVCSITFAVAITAISSISMSLTANCLGGSFINISDFKVINDKNLIQDGVRDNNYKALYKDGKFYKAEPSLSVAEFVLKENLNYEKANEQIIEIFKEVYPDNYLDVSFNDLSASEYDEYMKNYKPNIWSDTKDGITTYTVYIGGVTLGDEELAEAKKYSKVLMEKLNKENLISAFYDFGEVYHVMKCDHNKMLYSVVENIDLLNKYINENNIDCTLEKFDDHFYQLKSKDNDPLKEFLIAADIYEATSIWIYPITTQETNLPSDVYGKNSLEDIADVTTPAETEPTTTETTTVSTTAATKITTAASNTTLTTITAPAEEIKPVGDADGDNEVTVRDCSFIAVKLAKNEMQSLPKTADYNKDGFINVRDPAAIARDIAKVK